MQRRETGRMNEKETGRSMIEMLAVLGLMGVLSVGGILGYSYAMKLYQEAETLDQLSVTVSGARTWDIPLHFGHQTVGLSNDYVPYIVPIRDVVSRVKYRSDKTALDEGLVDEEGVLASGVTMHDVRELESFDTLVGAPAWVRAENENFWTVRMTGLSYSMCEKILSKSELGFDYAYVALQGGDKMPMDPSMEDFSGVTEKYRNPQKIKAGEEGEKKISTPEQIQKICSILDETKGSIAPVQTYIRNIDNPKVAGIAPGMEGSVCQDKKSIQCLASGARVLNEETDKVELPLQTLVLYFGKDEGITPLPPMVCRSGTPYTEESGGKVMDEQCCLILTDTYYMEQGPRCCKITGNTLNTPRCLMDSTGFYAIDIKYEKDASGNYIMPPRPYEDKRLVDANKKSEEVVYLSPLGWDGKLDGLCCPAMEYPTDTTGQGCHMSSQDGTFMPWKDIESLGTDTKQYQNCPHGAAGQTTREITELCCNASGGYWSEKTGEDVGSVHTTMDGDAFCCAKGETISYQSVSILTQCSWIKSPNVPVGATTMSGANPTDIFGAVDANCCYKTAVAGKSTDTACAYEAGVLKYSATCCNASTDGADNPLQYVYAPHYDPAGATSTECGVMVGGTTSTPEPDRNCCVDYSRVESALPSKTNLPYDIEPKDWSGMVSTEYCCKALIGTKLAPTEILMKKNYKNCCNSYLWFDTSIPDIRTKGTFIEAGTVIVNYAILRTCPSPYTGNHCLKNGSEYVTQEHNCCDLATGKSVDGGENKVCCYEASKTQPLVWNGSACIPCPSCFALKESDSPDPEPIPSDIPDSDIPDDGQCYYTCQVIINIPGQTRYEDHPECMNPCTKINGNCCQSVGYLHNGKYSTSCCPPGAWAPNPIPGDIADAGCYINVRVPVTTPGSMQVRQKKVGTDCPAGVSPGTDLGYRGNCP